MSTLCIDAVADSNGVTTLDEGSDVTTQTDEVSNTSSANNIWQG